MPPHLHPRSRMTTSLFTTTLMVSFIVVAAPHIIPCPVDPRTRADSSDPTGKSRPRRRRKVLEDETCNDVMSEERRKRADFEERMKPIRECPVPKPGGLIGQALGVKPNETEESDEEQLSILQRVERVVCKPKSQSSPRDEKQ